MKTINVDEAVHFNLAATQDTDFNLTLQFPQPLEHNGIVKLELAGHIDTIAWTGILSNDKRSVRFNARYTTMNFATGVYQYVITYQTTNSSVNLFKGSFIFKPRFA